MNICTYEQWDVEKRTFLDLHGLVKIETSSMDKYGKYHKEYYCADGGMWYEIMSPEYNNVKTTVNVKGIDVVVTKEVVLFRTEYYSTDNASSKFYYEPY